MTVLDNPSILSSNVCPFSTLGVLMHPRDYMSFKQLEQATGIPAGTLRRWATECKWSYITVDGVRRYRVSDVNNKHKQYVRRHLVRKLTGKEAA